MKNVSHAFFIDDRKANTYIQKDFRENKNSLHVRKSLKSKGKIPFE